MILPFQANGPKNPRPCIFFPQPFSRNLLRNSQNSSFDWTTLILDFQDGRHPKRSHFSSWRKSFQSVWQTSWRKLIYCQRSCSTCPQFISWKTGMRWASRKSLSLRVNHRIQILWSCEYIYEKHRHNENIIPTFLLIIFSL